MEHDQTTGTTEGQAKARGDLRDQVAGMLGLRPETRQHLRNARIEILKAVRSVIDSRIENLSHREERGTKVSVD